MGKLARAKREIAQSRRRMEEVSRRPGGAQAVELLASRVAKGEADKAAAEKAIGEAKQALQEVRELSAVRQTQERNRARLNEKPKKPRKGRKARGPTAEEIEQRFNEELVGYAMRSVGAMQQVGKSAEEWAEMELRNVEWEIGRASGRERGRQDGKSGVVGV